MTLHDRLMEIVQRIRTVNEEGKRGSIPGSDTIYRKHLSDLVEDEERMRFYLRLLTEAHYIFTVHLVEPDERLLIHGLDGYIVCDISVVMRLKEMAYSELELAYEGQYYRRKQGTQIVRELIGNARQFNNTPLGKALNLGMMLQQFEQFLANRFSEFSEGWKYQKLVSIFPDVLNEDRSSASSAQPAQSSRRAADSDHARHVVEMDSTGKWGQAVSKFGVEFLVRIHLRKYEFDRVKQLIKQHKITDEKDLRFIRDSLRKMESRLEEDPGLKPHVEAMTELRRLAQLRMNQVILARRQTELPGDF